MKMEGGGHKGNDEVERGRSNARRERDEQINKEVARGKTDNKEQRKSKIIPPRLHQKPLYSTNEAAVSGNREARASERGPLQQLAV